MNAAKKLFSKKILATAVAAGLLTLAAASAHASLEWRLTDGALVVTIIDGGAFDIDGVVNDSITVNVGLVNAALAGAGSKFRFTAAGANDNIAAATTLDVLNTSDTVSVATGGAETLTLDVSRDGWLVPPGTKTLTNGPTATLTLTGTGTDSSTGFNDGGNVLFGQQFFTPTSVFLAGNGPLCTAILGGVSTCNDLTQRTGIVESSPFSLSSRQVIFAPAGAAPAGENFLVTDATTKFGQVVVVPEPASLLLFGIGLTGLGFARRSKS